MAELITRFLIGGIVVSLFALTGDVLRPKSFAGLFGAAPSIALATIGLTIAKSGAQYASIESRSMVLGSTGFSRIRNRRELRISALQALDSTCHDQPHACLGRDLLWLVVLDTEVIAND